MNRRDGFLLLGVNEYLAGAPVPALEHEVSLKCFVMFNILKKLKTNQQKTAPGICRVKWHAGVYGN